jgi:F-type H+-transporting ATPase subunit epsilon
MPEFAFEVLTPYRRFFSGRASSISFETEDGGIEILANHEPMVAPLRVCALRIRGPELERVAAVTEGFVRVKTDRVDVFVDAAEWPEEIDRERAERSLGRATKRLADETQEWLVFRAKRAAERARNRLKVASLAPLPAQK